MYIAKTRRFKNEYGNLITLNGLLKPSNAGICEHVIYGISGPQSKTSNTVTVEEAKAIRDLLIELVGAP